MALRGNPSLSKAIFQQVRKVTEEREGVAPTPLSVERNAGAYNSLNQRQKINEREEDRSITKSKYMGLEVETVKKVNLNKYFDSLYESLSLLKDTKDYSSVVRELFTFYLAGKLNEHVLEGISKEDKSEMIGIIKDFENTLRNILV